MFLLFQKKLIVNSFLQEWKEAWRIDSRAGKERSSHIEKGWKRSGNSQNLRNFPPLSIGGSRVCTLLNLNVSSHEFVCVLALAQEFSCFIAFFGMVCVVTPAKSSRVVCRNGSCANWSWFGAFTRRKLSGPMCSMICATTFPMLRTTSRCSCNL